MSYSQHRGRGIGRILHCLQTYTKHPFVDTMVFETDCVLLHGTLFATYIWPTTPADLFDTPTFTFKYGEIAYFHSNQAILQPFVDDIILRNYATWFVQQIRDKISFSHARTIRFVRDKLNGEWDCNSEKADEKVKSILSEEIFKLSKYTSKFFISGKKYEGTLQQFVNDYWQHFALCAVLDI